MKKEFKLEDYTEDKGKFAMSFNHRSELIEFCFYLHSKGRKWINENTYTDIEELDFLYHRYKNFILYFNEGVYGESTDIIKKDYTILEYFDFDYDYQNDGKMKELENRVAELEKQVRELKGENIEDKELLNGKFICVKEFSSYTTKGKIYEFIDGFSKYDNGKCFPQARGGFDSLDDLNNTIGVFEPYVEEETVEDELLNGKFICTYGIGESTTTAGKVYEFKDGFSKYNEGDKMSNYGKPFKNLEELNKTMASKFEPYVEEELLNGKFVCVETSSIFLTVGKIYEFINGFSKYDDGDKMPWSNPTKNLEDLNSRMISKFIPFVENKVEEEDLSDGAFVYTKDSHNFLTKKKLCEWMDS